MGWAIMFLVLIALVIILSISLINWKIQIYKVIVQLNAILNGETKKLVTISLTDRRLEHLVEIINQIVSKDNIYLGEMKEAIYHPPTYFDNRYEDEWITDSLSVKMIKDVDKSDVVSERLIQSPVLGPISVKEISGGVKTLILMAFDDSGRIFNASACGNNCAKWILEIGKQKKQENG